MMGMNAAIAEELAKKLQAKQSEETQERPPIPAIEITTPDEIKEQVPIEKPKPTTPAAEPVHTETVSDANVAADSETIETKDTDTSSEKDNDVTNNSSTNNTPTGHAPTSYAPTGNEVTVEAIVEQPTPPEPTPRKPVPHAQANFGLDELDSQGNPLSVQNGVVAHIPPKRKTISIGVQTLPPPEKPIQLQEIPTRKDGAKEIEPSFGCVAFRKLFKSKKKR
jgi:hypothetical protein